MWQHRALIQSCQPTGEILEQQVVDSTVSAVVGTSAVVRCPNTAMSSLILVVWKIRPKNGTRCTLAYRADTNKTGGINCSERVTWDSSPNHEAALQIHPVRLTDEGIYICEIGTSDGTFCQVSALTVLVPPLVTLTRDSNGVVVCQASAGKPAAEISWVPENGHSIENKTHHTNGTVTLLSSVSWINSTSDHVTCLVTHPAMNQTQTIELSPQPSADVTFPPMLYYFLIIASSGVAVAVVVLILYWTLKCRASRLSGLADDATVPNTNFLRMKSSPLRSIISSQDFLTVFSSLFPFDAAQDNAPVTHLEPRHQPLLDTEKGLGALIPARSQDTEMPSCLIPASIQREGNAQMLPCCLCWRVNLGLIHCLGLCTVVVP
ncbi:cell surface glycoprotein CD200 receptor 1-B-like isoform X2 [Emydura macquarii macquarii]|uniref:cell surface glycoprotein CD200 receptor 1-B-like isoform X2 n=1 Tax=Emydura macquarii macquarii TaxID=1129001 RepID=UPI003529DFB7